MYNSYTNYGRTRQLEDGEFRTDLVNNGVLGRVVLLVEAVLSASHQAAGLVTQTGLRLGTAYAI